MKVIFLDVDGVLNCSADCIATKHKMRVNGTGFIGIYLPRVKNLKTIVDNTDAKIVLTSTWKQDYLEYIEQYHKGIPAVERNPYGRYLRNKLRKCGLDVYDTTYDYERNCAHRDEGIVGYLNAHPDITDYVILDDDYFLGYENFKHVIYTNGLSKKQAELAIRYLRGKEE